MPPTRHALVLAALACLNTGCARAEYTDSQFEEALFGYIALAHDDLPTAARDLFDTGMDARSTPMLRDATLAAIRLRDIELAVRAGEQWHAHGGGTEALETLVRLKVGTEGVTPNQALIRRLAEETEPHTIYSILRASGADKAEQVRIMRASHPLHLRSSEYVAYLAQLQLATGDTPGAVAMVNDALMDDPTSVELLLVALLVADEVDNKPSAMSIVRRLAAIGDVGLGAAVQAYNRWKAGLTEAGNRLPNGEELSQGHHSAQTHLLAGTFLLDHDEPAEALAVYRQIPRQAAEWPYGISGQVAALRRLGDGHGAQIRALLEEAMAGSPAEQQPLFASEYARELRAAQGHPAAYAFLVSKPYLSDSPQMLFELSIDAERSGRVPEAESALRRFIELQPESADGYNALAYLFAVHAYNIPEAAALVTRALQINPGSAAIIDTHAWVLFRQGRVREAISRLEEALNILGEPNAEIMAHLGEALWAAGQHDRAVRIWQAAYAHDPDDHFLLDTLARHAGAAAVAEITR